MPFALNPEAAVDCIIDFGIQLNVKLHRRETTKLEDEVYNCLLHNMLNFLESLNNQATKFQWSYHVEII